MLKVWKPVILFIAVTYLTANTAFAGGLSSRFVEVRVKDVIPGETYSVKELTGKILDVKSTTEDLTVDIGIEPEMPADYNLVSGYEPIPELSWVKIDKDYFKDVGPGDSIETDVFITIPKNREHAGKKYQVYIYSHTAGKETFRMGIMGRILIEIAASPSKKNSPRQPQPGEKKGIFSILFGR